MSDLIFWFIFVLTKGSYDVFKSLWIWYSVSGLHCPAIIGRQACKRRWNRGGNRFTCRLYGQDFAAAHDKSVVKSINFVPLSLHKILFNIEILLVFTHNSLILFKYSYQKIIYRNLIRNTMVINFLNHSIVCLN